MLTPKNMRQCTILVTDFRRKINIYYLKKFQFLINQFHNKIKVR